MEKKKITSRRATTVAKRARVEMVQSVEDMITKVVRKVLDDELEERVARILQQNDGTAKMAKRIIHGN